jgi:hypothetical protein
VAIRATHNFAALDGLRQVAAVTFLREFNSTRRDPSSVHIDTLQRDWSATKNRVGFKIFLHKSSEYEG